MALLANFALAMLVLSLCRVFFYIVNQSAYPTVDFPRLLHLMAAGIRFDLAACIYLNIAYMVVMLLPSPWRSREGYQTVAKWLYYVPNLLGVLLNSGDCVYYQFSNRRTTLSVFSEFSNEGNMMTIFLNSIVNYWYVTLFFFLMAFLLWKCYFRPDRVASSASKPWIPYVVGCSLLAVTALGAVVGIRGGWGKYTRPLAVANAMQYVDKPEETAIVLNTPFCVIRTAKRQKFTVPDYFADQKEAAALYTPIHMPKVQETFVAKNVVVIIMESFGKEHMGLFNRDLDNGTYRGYTPFLDSLFQQGYTFKYSYANGRKSIDAMPSVLASIPMFVEPYVTTNYALNRVDGLPRLLKKKGYYSSFFHGAPNGSMGFQSFAKSIGFDDYFGMTEFDDDSQFDGTWAIWDDPFFQFFAREMDRFEQPFMTAIFSASSHDPFRVPEAYRDTFPKGTMPIHPCIGYSDMALRHFFERASHSDWYKNTLFVFTADHTNQTKHAEYLTQLGHYEVPILFFAPGDDSLVGKSSALAQQIDVMPTVLSYLHYDEPYVAFGKNCLDSIASNSAVMYNAPFYQYLQDSLMICFDGERVRSAYDFKHDRMLLEDLSDGSSLQEEMQKRLKSVIQQYMYRMVNDELTYTGKEK